MLADAEAVERAGAFAVVVEGVPAAVAAKVTAAVGIPTVGIFGTDMHWYSDGGIGSLRATYPQVLGHEPAGEIAAWGPGTGNLTAGQKVVIEPTITCGQCEFCCAGRHNNCVSVIFMSSPQMPGLFRETTSIRCPKE